MYRKTIVEGGMSGGDENFVDEGIDSLQNIEVGILGALLVQIGHRLPF